MAILAEAERHRLADSDFAVPGKRKLPIYDEEHARLAWDMLDRTEGLSPYEREEARSRIVHALHRHGVKMAHATEDRAATFVPMTATEGAPVHEATIADDASHLIDVTVIRPGVSQNGYNYNEAVLREATPLWNGAAAFVDHPNAIDLTRAGGRSLRDLVGVYENARYDNGIRAHLRLLNTPDGNAAFATIKEALTARSAGRPSPPIGISADWRLLKSPAQPSADSKARWQVHAITAVQSGDLVFRPSAGGSFDRILEGVAPAALPDSLWKELTMPDAPVTPPTAPPAAPDSARNTLPPADSALTTQYSALVNAAVQEATLPIRLQLAAAMLDQKLSASNLPAPAQASVRQQFAGRVFESAAADGAIAAMKSMLGEIFGGSTIKGAGAGIVSSSNVRVGASPLDKVQAAFDRLFGLKIPETLTDVPRLSGIREAYILITGDKGFTGRYNWEESIVREANEVTTSVMANVVKYAKQLQYRGWPAGDAG